MSDLDESGDIKESFVEDENKVNIGTTSVNLDFIKNEPNDEALDTYTTRYRTTLENENIFGEPSYQRIDDYDNLIGFEDDVIMENEMIKLEAVKKEDDWSFNKFHCSKCKGIYKGYCLKCTTLSCILNNNLALANCDSNTIPIDILEIRESSTGKGVYLLRTLPINIIFGPFEGILGIESTVGHSWKIIDNKFSNIKCGNWMKNIVCAANASLKNMEIFQIDGNLYFQTNREITEGEELLIYYDDEELQELDNSEECLYTPQKQDKLPKLFTCTVCCLGFGSNTCLIEHKRKYCRMEHSKSMKDFVLIECDYCNMWMEKWEHDKYHVAPCLEKYHRTRNNYSEAVDRSGMDVDDCDIKDDKRICQRDICSRQYDRRDDLQFDTKGYQCFSGGNHESPLNECTFAEGSNNEQIQNAIEANYKGDLQTNLNKHRSIKEFQCDICMVKFTRKFHLARHIKNKHRDDGTTKDYKCLDCSFQTNYKKCFQLHINKHRGIKPFTCTICSKKFLRKAQLKMHTKNKHTDDGTAKDHKCLECNYQTNYKADLRRHINKHRGIKEFQCDICMMNFIRKSNLTSHIKNKHTDDGSAKDYKCLECSFVTNYKRCFQMHLNKHRGIKQFQCESCTMEFRQKSQLKAHIRDKHTDDGSVKDYKCSECLYQTNNKSNFQKHVNKHKGICTMTFPQKHNLKDIKDEHRKRSFKCDICTMTFTWKNNLKRHIKDKHADDGSVKDFNCLECSYQTNYKSNFEMHLNKHGGIKPFKCDICMMTFAWKCNLITHVKNKHTNDGSVKDYKCSECSYKSNYKNHFLQHLNKHTGTKSFKCDICMMTFAQKSSLSRHIKQKHTGSAKDYKCLECSYRTNYKANLQMHLSRHSGIKQFQCDICMGKFARQDNLKKHIKNKHTTM